MMRIAELPQAIYRAINGWRVWVTLLLLASLILNEAALGIREGQTIVEALRAFRTHGCCWLSYAA